MSHARAAVLVYARNIVRAERSAAPSQAWCILCTHTLCTHTLCMHTLRAGSMATISYIAYNKPRPSVYEINDRVLGRHHDPHPINVINVYVCAHTRAHLC